MLQTVLITGCSSGIGNALAKEFKARGLRVFATARNADSLSDLAALDIEPVSLEVTSEESIEALKQVITERTQGAGLDFLVNNAGRNYTCPALDVEYDEIQATFETNVFAVMRMCQAFAPLLIEAKGTIIQIGSVAAIIPYVFGSVYNSSKGALHSYSDTLRVELAPFDVKVITVITGGVKSSIARTKRTLPEDSIYVPLTAEYERRQGHSQEGAMANEAYAKSVVSQVLRTVPRLYIWEGNKSWTVWQVSLWCATITATNTCL